MAARSSWKGYLRVSLVSVPVKAYTATASGGGDIHLNQLHEDCHNRIRYQKVCPVHGPVPNDEIVSGYQFAKDQYVVIDPDDLKQLRPKGDKAIDVDAFVSQDEIDATYYAGKSYYLVPDGPIAQKPYRLIRDALREENLLAIAEVIMSNREQLVVIRPQEQLLTMNVLEYKSKIKQPSSFQDEVVDGEVSGQELKLTKQLMEGLRREDWDLNDYQDAYTERLSELIEARIEGEELVSAPQADEPQVINLMDALKASLEQIPVPEKRSASSAAKKSKPARKAAANVKSRGGRKKATKKKSG
ncbi:non-homologous end joining protein Ku [Roseiconus nitratireducens]|nr:Ku protein [Roseiconus nitratireducens]